MEVAEDILTQARTNTNMPKNWRVFPLLRGKVIWGIAGWAFGIVLGLGLLALLAPIVIPGNYQHGAVPALITTVLLGIFLFIGLGSLWTLIVDVQRLSQADKHLIVITPEDFVKQEGEKIVHVPLVYVCHVTTRGIRPADPDDVVVNAGGGNRTQIRRTTANQGGVRQISSAAENLTGLIFGRGLVPSGQRWRRKRMRTPMSLAFIDIRTDSEVTVVTDEAYGDPTMIAAFLKEYAAHVIH